MSRNAKDVVVGELLYLILGQIIVLLIVVGRGILFGEWYKEYTNIFLAGFLVYLFLLILRGLIKISKNMRKRGF